MRIKHCGYFYDEIVSRWPMRASEEFRFVATRLILLFLFTFLLDVRLAKSEEMLAVEPTVELKRLRTDLLKTYERLQSPTAKNTNQPTVVKVFFDTQYIVSLEEKYQILTVKGILMMQWTDGRLTWSPESYSGIHGLHFSPKEIWLPDVHSVYNVKPMEISNSRTPATVYSNGSVKWYVPAVFDVPCSAQYKHYPFDSHNCSIFLSTWSQNLQDVSLEKLDSSHASTAQGTEWTVTRIDQESVQVDVDFFKKHHIRVNLFLERTSRIYRYICVIPTLMSMISLICGFWLLPDETSRYLVGCSNIIVLSMLLQHLAVVVPTGKVVPLLAQYCASCLCMSAAFVIITVVANLLRECSGKPPNGLVRLAYFSLDRYLCLFAFSHISSGNKMSIGPAVGGTAENVLPDEVKRRKDWYCVAVLFDRIAFWCFVCIFVVLLAVLAAI